MDNSGKANGCLVSVIIALVLLIIILAVVFSVFFINRKDMPDVAQFIEEIENSERTTDNKSSITDIIQIQPDKGTSTKISIVLTNADLTVLANDTVDSNPDIPLKDILIKCNEDETIDVTGVITDVSMYADNPDISFLEGLFLSSVKGKRIYVSVKIDYLGNNNFDITILNVKVDDVTIPIIQAISDSVTSNLENMLHDRLESQANFDLQTFKVEKDQLSLSALIIE